MAEAMRLLERMRRTRWGWTASDLDRLYRSFGFEMDEGSKHRVYIHPRHTDLRATVSRSSGTLGPGYAQNAVSLIGTLMEREERGDAGSV